jgi:hypothetical protein
MRKFTGVCLSILLIGLTLEAKERPTTRSEIVKSPSQLKLAFPGEKGPADYESCGHFDGVGTKTYRYIFTDQKKLGKQVGEGIFPNNDTLKDPRYRELLQAHKLEGNQWIFADLKDAELAFYKWATVNEDPGVKWFMTAIMLERAGYIAEAIKGFYAVAVHFPKTISYTYYKTPWYVGPAALDRAEQLLRRHPAIKMELKDATIRIGNHFDTDVKNDDFQPNPGRLVAVKNKKSDKPIDLSKLKVVKEVGGPKVVLRKYENGHWQLLVDGKPFVIKGLTYSVTPVGRSPDRGNWNVSTDWQTIDTNKNGLHDGFFESWVDKNGNNQQDADEPTVGDAKLLQDLGVNTLRAYHHIANKELFRKLHKDYGLYILCGDLMGVYAVGSGASWKDGTDYSNPTQRQTMLDSVKQMVEEDKDEPYILMWVLGNENIYGVANNSPKDPAAFYSLINEAAELIHKLDPTRPVAIANGDLLHLDVIKEKCPALDVIGANAYRGEQGFGRHLFLDVKETIDKPIMITEYGASAYAEGYSQEEAEAYHAMYLANNWEDLRANMAGRGAGNALGGVLFEYMDEWWKANSDLPEYVQRERPDWYAKRSATYKHLQPENHDTVPQFGFPFLDGWSYEEWYGLVGQGDGKGSPFARVLRPAYFEMKDAFHDK